MFKLLDNPPPYYGQEDNPFSVVFETAWYALNQNKLKTDEDLMNLKFRLMRRLIQNKNEVSTIYAILDFINIYLPFENPKKELTFDQEIESIIDKENNMEALTMRDIRDRRLREEGEKLYKKEVRRHQKTEKMHQEAARMRQEEARMRQEEARMRQEKLAAVVMKLHKQGFSAEDIADMQLEPLSLIQAIIHSTPSV